MLRDWQKSKAAHDPKYPQVQTVEIALSLWSEVDQLAYITERVNLFEANKAVPDDDLPLCSAEDRWQEADKYAVMKPGRKSAVRVLDSHADAVGMAANLDGGHYVQGRPGEPRRCADYCPAAPWCNQWQGEIAGKPYPEDAA
jgi:hypothetical protein